MVRSSSRAVRAILLASGVFLAGCDAKHLMLAKGVEVMDLGPASIVPVSSPVIAPDGSSVIYLRAASGSLTAVSRDLGNGSESNLFDVPNGSILWTLNYGVGTLLLSIASGGNGRHVVEYSVSGTVARNFTVPSGYQDYNACISPDDSTLAFVRISDATGVAQLCIRDTSDPNSPAQPLWTFINSEAVLALRWLTNTQLLVSGTAGQNTLVNVIQDTSTGVRSNAPGLALSSTPSPNGLRVAGIIGSTGAMDLWLSRLDGEAMTRLTNSVSSKGGINWSRDGQVLVYKTIRGQPPTTGLEVLSLPPLQ